MFDLDGTLVRFLQNDFINAYFKELSKVFVKLGLDAEAAVKAVWVGTNAMIKNDGAVLNTQRFWEAFSESLGVRGTQLDEVEAACDSFYSTEFNIAKKVVTQSDVPKRIVRNMAARGCNIVLATNPLFPPCAVDSRLGWIGLERRDFSLITHYENSTFCKPNLAYYQEIFGKICKLPTQCLMVGNNPAEDMCVSELGTETFLVTDFMENEANIDITAFRHGSIEELEAYLTSLPKLSD